MKPSIRKVAKIVSILLGIFLACVVVGTVFVIQLIGEPSREEILRLRSPSGDIDAIVIEVNGGATTSFAYEVRLEEPRVGRESTKVAYFYDPWRNVKGSRGLDLKWVSANELHIEYFASRTHTEELIVPVSKFSNQTIRVFLKPGTDNQSAPFSMKKSVSGR